MATVLTDVATFQASTNPKDRGDANKVSAEIRIAEAVYTTTAGWSDGDIINVVTLPIGAIVLPERSWVATEATGGTGTAISKIGDASDDDRYSSTSITLTSAATIAVTAASSTGTIVRTPVTSATNTIKATCALSSSTVTAGKKIRFSIAYILP
ncbi:hypothetical protein TSACC_21705 [Terrimicrobium sacchariphilum]|uniref:Uncharacterized protein n=1 Tax=Terrimicrobium sacchariphilum TaxID=690879 RepID=A0A146G7F7_TERSA|nr:hypothetical protein [Terrimicrobium sacchariphilum]GAT33292.1 hypothetical protein TSACC_21705 [Terrimicrobium sacchariphilum]